MNDADALLHLLSHTDAATKLPYLNELLANARRPMVKVVATNASFESKDNLKERGYYWDAAGKVWSKVIFSDELPAETAWLEAAVYNGSFRGQTQEIPIKENFRT